MPVVQSAQPTSRRTGPGHRDGIPTPRAGPVQGLPAEPRGDRWYLS